MKSPKAPQAPDPMVTAAAQSASNRDTAINNQALNMVDQIGPDGSLTYSRGQDQTFTDSLTGRSYTLPKYVATTKLSDAQQAIKDVNDRTELSLAGIGERQTAKIGNILDTPMKIGNEETESRLFDLGSKRLDPMFQRNEDQLRTRLINQGINPGSAAWDAEFTNFNQGRNDAYNNLLLSGRGQAVQEQLAERNQPLNEISALLSGSQVSQPNFINTPQTQVAGTDYAGIVNSNFQNQMSVYNSKMNQQNAMMGGLFGLAANGATAGIKYGLK